MDGHERCWAQASMQAISLDDGEEKTIETKNKNELDEEGFTQS